VYLRHLQLGSFRNWDRVDLALGPGPVVFVGRNGEGKTNLVEAVGYLATLGSHRVSSDAPLVRTGAEQAVVRAALRRDERELLVEVEVNPGRANRVRVNRGALPRPRELLGLVRTVLFAPEDLALVRGDPTERRRFLDELLVSRTPRLAGVRSDYDRVLKQRNALLKTSRLAKGKALETLEVWDGHLTDLGGQLLAARIALIADLQPQLTRAYAQVAGGDAVTAALGYSSTVPAAGDGTPLGAPDILPSDTLPSDILPSDILPSAADLTAAMRQRVTERRSEELDRGVTLVGPHRDDLVIHLGSVPAKGFASHGESWSLALGLKLATFALLRADGEDPILILDDVFATLDAGRRTALAEVARSAEQTLITAAVLDDVPAELRGVLVEVGGGRAVVVREGSE
jgi:DNA replication and repair protein RecF